MKEFFSNLIKVNSIKSTPTDNAPFGQAIRDALDVFLDKAKSLGFKTHDENGYYGWAEYGTGENMLALACHIDIVPATGKWETSPFELVNKDGILYGRGVADDKGAIVLALALLDYLKTNEITLKHRVRVIVGCDEESGSECLHKYARVDEIPAFTLVPDADFPVVNSEKGIYHLTLSSFIPLKDEIVEIYGGERPNIVCDKVYARIKKDGVIGKFIAQNGVENTLNCIKITDTLSRFSVNPKDLKIEEENDFYIVSAFGIASHAMCPENGDNAITKLLAFIYSFEKEVDLSVLGNLLTKVCSKNIAKKLCIDCADNESGALTINLGIIRFDGENLTLTFDSRLPLCAKKDRIKDALYHALGQVETVSSHYSPNLYIPENSPTIQALLSAYKDVMDEEGKCIKLGGGTYARSLPNAVAFGPCFEGFDTDIHNANEKIRVSDLEKAFEIYKKAILTLDNIL